MERLLIRPFRKIAAEVPQALRQVGEGHCLRPACAFVFPLGDFRRCDGAISFRELLDQRSQAAQLTYRRSITYLPFPEMGVLSMDSTS